MMIVFIELMTKVFRTFGMKRKCTCEFRINARSYVIYFDRLRSVSPITFKYISFTPRGDINFSPKYMPPMRGAQKLLEWLKNYE